MNSDHIELPYALVDYTGQLQILFLYDDVVIRCCQGPDPIKIPECPVAPLVKLQQLDNGAKPVGPVWVFDHERGWATYDERFHPIPESGALVDAGTESTQLNLNASSEVELSHEVAPTSETLPEQDAEAELDEPSYGDEEDEVTAD